MVPFSLHFVVVVVVAVVEEVMVVCVCVYISNYANTVYSVHIM